MGQINIFPARLCFSTRVIVEGDDGFGVVQHGGHKYFSGFDIEFIKGADADDVDSYNFVSGVQRYDARILKELCSF
jgi:hypothetical protein